MSRNILSLDFYGRSVTAALAALDEETAALRLRHVLKRPMKSFSCAFVRNMDAARQELSSVFAEISEYVSADLTVVVGLRGTFLSFKHTNGFHTITSRNRIVGTKEIDAAIEASIPPNLSETLDVVDILPQCYAIDGNLNIENPKGMAGFTLGAETFLSFGLVTHLDNLNNILASCGCNTYQMIPTSVALGETLLRYDEKQAGVLLVDIGMDNSSALLTHQGSIVDAWELSAGKNDAAQAVADILQNDIETAREVLAGYEPGTDDIMDEVLEDAAEKLLQNIKKELYQSLSFLKYQPPQLVLCGEAADKSLLKSAKKIFNVRKARLAQFDDVIADCPAEQSVYTGAVALLRHALDREQKHLGVAQAKEEGLLDGLLDKLGLSELFNG